ncbi:MAG: hypothetical protein OJI70_12175 [Zavarzinia sp.]|nr:hypothetical protein [Zavarzinia sp.]
MCTEPPFLSGLDPAMHSTLRARARRAAGKPQRDDAFRLCILCMLSVRGRFDPPQWALRRLAPGDLAECRAALAADWEKHQHERKP